MNIAELFVNLGIKGAEKTVGALGKVRKGLGEVSSMSIEAKAGILGAMYGLERMMAISGQTGTALTNFSALTGMSAKSLQQWQYAARQAGVGADEMTGNLKGVQNVMTNMLMGKGAPEGMALLSKAVGGLDPHKYQDTLYMMTKLQEGMQKMSPQMSQLVGRSFGLSEGVIAAMRRNAFTPDIFKKAPMYSNNEVNSLNRSNIAWSNLGNKVEMAFGHFNAKHGQELVKDFSKIADSVFKLVNAFTVLAEKIKFFQGVAKVFDGWTMIFNGLTGAVNDVNKDKKGILHGLWEKTKGAASETYDAYKGMTMNDQEYFAPKVQRPPPVNHSHSTQITQHITHHGDAKDTHAVKDMHRAAINHAYRQRPAQRQGS